jgi:hypothetical protein
LETWQKAIQQDSIEIMASLAPSQSEVKAGVRLRMTENRVLTVVANNVNYENIVCINSKGKFQ